MSDYETASEVAMASCDNELLEAHALGRSGSRAPAVVAHVATCVVCRQELAELARERALFAAVAPPPGADLPSFSQVYAATQVARSAVRAKQARRVAGVASFASLAVAAVALLAVGTKSFRVSTLGAGASEGAALITAEGESSDATLFESDNEELLGATCGGHAHRVCALELPVNHDDRISKYEAPISVTRETFSSIRRNVCE